MFNTMNIIQLKPKKLQIELRIANCKLLIANCKLNRVCEILRRILIEGLMNMRDLGGYDTCYNNSEVTCTIHSRFIRSDAPLAIKDSEAALLLKQHINTVIDLRNALEIEKRPCVFKDKAGFIYYHCPMFGDGRLPLSEAEVSNSYFEMVHEEKSVFKIMKTIAAAPEGVIFHCTAGKDRTGVIAALLLSLVGVSKKDILEDYQVTYTYIRKMVEELHSNTPDLPAFIGQSKIEYMENFLETFYKEYGTTEYYLLKINLTRYEIAKIKDKLTKKS